MLKRSLILLLFLLDIFSDSSRISPRSPEEELTSVEKALIVMIQKCDLGLKNIIFYTGNNPDLTSAVLDIRPSENLGSLFLLSIPEITDFGILTGINGFVVVYNSNEEWKHLFIKMTYFWECLKDCTVIIVSNGQNSCLNVKTTLKSFGYQHYYIVYFVCVDLQRGPVVITQNKYSGVRPFNWEKMPWTVESSLYPWSFYLRHYHPDFCSNFNFNRTLPKRNIGILVEYTGAVTDASELKPGYIFEGIIVGRDGKLQAPDLELYERLLKIDFYYYVRSYLNQNGNASDNENLFTWLNACTDISFQGTEVFDDPYRVFLFPRMYSSYIILSHMPRFATPLEKIAQFYGIWTLFSLLTILIVTFVVLYLKTNRNAAFAAFDVLRLLINSGVETPINTLSLKIFFCMVFLYFTVIHATFSGNLPKFLTIPELYGCIDTIEDLARPQITTIYKAGFEYSDEKDIEILEKKTKEILDIGLIFDSFMEKQSSACIFSRHDAERYAFKHNISTKFYRSKNNLGLVMGARQIRPRFFLREKFQWASTYIFDVGVDINSVESLNKAIRNIKKIKSLSEIDFRPIAIDDLKFAFIFLSIGNTLGIICFLIELVIGKKYYQKISFKNFKGIMAFKSRKKRTNIRRIVVMPKQSESEFGTTKKFKSNRN